MTQSGHWVTGFGWNRLRKFDQCVSVPAGRRTVNTEPLPGSLATVTCFLYGWRFLNLKSTFL
jgi:hypothetical protein